MLYEPCSIKAKAPTDEHHLITTKYWYSGEKHTELRPDMDVEMRRFEYDAKGRAAVVKDTIDTWQDDHDLYGKR